MKIKTPILFLVLLFTAFSCEWFAGDEKCMMGCMISQPQVEIGELNRVYLTTFYCQKLLVYEKSGKPLAELFLGDYGDRYVFPRDVAVGNNRVHIAEPSEKKIFIFQ